MKKYLDPKADLAFKEIFGARRALPKVVPWDSRKDVKKDVKKDVRRGVRRAARKRGRRWSV